ncbi:hypothetical protein RI367_006646 [Sorochytrium milnesiophthora]
MPATMALPPKLAQSSTYSAAASSSSSSSPASPTSPASPIMPLDLEMVIASHPFFQSAIQATNGSPMLPAQQQSASPVLKASPLAHPQLAVNSPRMTALEATPNASLLNSAHLRSLTTRDLLSLMHVRHCAPGDVIIRHGTLGRSMFFLLRGSVNVVSRDSEIIFDTLTNGAIFGEIAVLLDMHRTANVIAVEKCLLLVLHKADLGKLSLRYPMLEKKIRMEAEARFTLLTKRLSQTTATTTTAITTTASTSVTLSTSTSINTTTATTTVGLGVSLPGEAAATRSTSPGLGHPAGGQILSKSPLASPTTSPTFDLPSDLEFGQTHRITAKDHLRHIPLFANCHDDFLHDLVKRMEYYRYAPSDIISRPLKSSLSSQGRHKHSLSLPLSLQPHEGAGTTAERFQTSNLYILLAGVVESFTPDVATTLSSMSLCKSSPGLSSSSTWSASQHASLTNCFSSLPSLTSLTDLSQRTTATAVNRGLQVTASLETTVSSYTSESPVVLDSTSSLSAMHGSPVIAFHSPPVAPLMPAGLERSQTLQAGSYFANLDWSCLTDLCAASSLPAAQYRLESNARFANGALAPVADEFHARNMIRAVTTCDVYIVSGEAVLDCLKLHPDIRDLLVHQQQSETTQSNESVRSTYADSPPTSPVSASHPNSPSVHTDGNMPTPPPAASHQRRASVAVWSDPRLLKFATDQMNKAVGLAALTPAAPSRFARADSDGLSDTDSVLSSVPSGEASVSSSRGCLTTTASPLVNIVGPDAVIAEPATPIATAPVLLSLLTLSRTGSPSGLAVMDSVCEYLGFAECCRLRRVNKTLSSYLQTHSHWRRVIDLSHRKHVHDGVLAIIARDCAHDVQVLSLRNCHSVTDLGVTTVLKQCLQLRSIDLANCWEVSNAVFVASLPAQSHLRSVDVSNLRKIDATALRVVLDRCPQLTRLSMSYCKTIGDDVFAHRQWRRLEYLHMQRCTGVSDTAFTSGWLPQLTSSPKAGPFALTYLNLADCSLLTDAAISALAALAPNLSALSLSFCCTLTENAVLDLARLPDLRALDLSFCGAAVSDSALHLLASNCTHLAALAIRGCARVSDTGVGFLFELAPALRVVNLSQCGGVSKQLRESLVTAQVPRWTLLSTEPVLEYYFRALAPPAVKRE